MEIVIQVSDYVAYQPNAANKYTSTEIQSAINLSYSLLDAECAGAITDRWSKTSTEEGYLTATQKAHIKNAFLIETQYVLMNGMDFSQGSDQLSFGSFNMSSNRPNRNLISPQALKELQLAGIWYQADFVQARNDSPRRFSYAEDMTVPLWVDDPLPQSVSDLRYIHKIAENEGSKGKFLKYDEQGIIEFVEGGIGGNWGSIIGDIQDQTDLQNEFATKQAKVYYGTEPTSPVDNDIWVEDTPGVSSSYDYNQLFNKPQINSITLQGNKTYTEMGLYGRYVEGGDAANNTYSAQEINQKISESAANFRGTYTAGATRPASFDYDTYLQSQVTETCYDGDYAYVYWSDLKVYDRCIYRINPSTSLGSWEFQISIIGEQIAEYVKSFSINGNRLTLTKQDATSQTYEPTIPTQVQSDWTQTDTTAVDYIKNKPTISSNHLYRHTVTLNGTHTTTELYDFGNIYISFYSTNSTAYDSVATLFNNEGSYFLKGTPIVWYRNNNIGSGVIVSSSFLPGNISTIECYLPSYNGMSFTTQSLVVTNYTLSNYNVKQIF